MVETCALLRSTHPGVLFSTNTCNPESLSRLLNLWEGRKRPHTTRIIGGKPPGSGRVGAIGQLVNPSQHNIIGISWRASRIALPISKLIT
jgi:hypothetical protein